MRPIGCPETSVNTSQRYVASPKSEDPTKSYLTCTTQWLHNHSILVIMSWSPDGFVHYFRYFSTAGTFRSPSSTNSSSEKSSENHICCRGFLSSPSVLYCTRGMFHLRSLPQNSCHGRDRNTHQFPFKSIPLHHSHDRLTVQRLLKFMHLKATFNKTQNLVQ